MSISVFDFPDSSSIIVRFESTGMTFSEGQSVVLEALSEYFGNRQRITSSEVVTYWNENCTTLFSKDESIALISRLLINNAYFMQMVLTSMEAPFSQVSIALPTETVEYLTAGEYRDTIVGEVDTGAVEPEDQNIIETEALQSPTVAVADEVVDLSTMTVKQLRTFAELNGIDLGTATKKSDIIKLIDQDDTAR